MSRAHTIQPSWLHGLLILAGMLTSACDLDLNGGTSNQLTSVHTFRVGDCNADGREDFVQITGFGVWYSSFCATWIAGGTGKVLQEQFLPWGMKHCPTLDVPRSGHDPMLLLTGFARHEDSVRQIEIRVDRAGLREFDLCDLVADAAKEDWIVASMEDDGARQLVALARWNAATKTRTLQLYDLHDGAKRVGPRHPIDIGISSACIGRFAPGSEADLCIAAFETNEVYLFDLGTDTLRRLQGPRGQGDEVGRFLVTVGDVDHDGLDDIVVGAHVLQGIYDEAARIDLISPATGKILWSKESLREQTPIDSMTRVVDDVDGDGVRDLAWVGERNSFVVLSGANGSRLSEVVLPDSKTPAVPRLVDDVQACADTDGDGRGDLLVTFVTDSRKLEEGVSAQAGMAIVSSRDGKILFEVQGCEREKKPAESEPVIQDGPHCENVSLPKR